MPRNPLTTIRTPEGPEAGESRQEIDVSEIIKTPVRQGEVDPWTLWDATDHHFADTYGRFGDENGAEVAAELVAALNSAAKLRERVEELTGLAKAMDELESGLAFQTQRCEFLVKSNDNYRELNANLYKDNQRLLEACEAAKEWLEMKCCDGQNGNCARCGDISQQLTAALSQKAGGE